ncbi:MAG: ATP-binding protein [Spirochaetales bacterium]|nr:ATP-binding protein [Spirochaetales bacterium]
MEYINRIIEKKLYDYLNIFPVIAITGPRQSGKSTLIQQCLEDKYRYITFDDPMTVDFFYSDPKGFMQQHADRIIFDEVQKVPEIFSYIKIEVDKDRQNYGKYILTGSSQFSLLKKISESLAGRIGLLSLLPFQYRELPDLQKKDQIIYGSYPELVVRKYKNTSEWFGSYINTYIEKDVRTLYNIGNLRDFQQLIRLLAARCSQELNMSSLSREIGVSVKTIQNWVSVLEASYIIFLLPPYHKNLGKRIIKRPKLYFFDTGLVCYLTGIESEDILNKGPLGGSIFENYITAETKKSLLHRDRKDQLFFFRNNAGLEVDLIIENSNERSLTYLEIKNNSTPKYKMTENLKLIMGLETGSSTRKGYLVYKGSEEGKFSENIEYINYRTYFDRII